MDNTDNSTPNPSSPRSEKNSLSDNLANSNTPSEKDMKEGGKKEDIKKMNARTKEEIAQLKKRLELEYGVDAFHYNDPLVLAYLNEFNKIIETHTTMTNTMMATGAMYEQALKEVLNSQKIISENVHISNDIIDNFAKNFSRILNEKLSEKMAVLDIGVNTVKVLTEDLNAQISGWKEFNRKQNKTLSIKLNGMDKKLLYWIVGGSLAITTLAVIITVTSASFFQSSYETKIKETEILERDLLERRQYERFVQWLKIKHPDVMKEYVKEEKK